MTKESKEEKPVKYTRMTPKQWAEAEALWESGEVTFAQLSAKFGKHVRTFKFHFKNHGIVRGSKKAAIKAAVHDAMSEEAAVLAARIRETKEDHYKMASGIAKLAWSEILQAKSSGSPLASVINNLKALDTAAAVLVKMRSERYAVLGLNEDKAEDDDGLPELIVKELTADQIAELRDRDNTAIDSLPDDDGEDDELEELEELEELDDSESED